jgi:hypothetical protein
VEGFSRKTQVVVVVAVEGWAGLIVSGPWVPG